MQAKEFIINANFFIEDNLGYDKFRKQHSSVNINLEGIVSFSFFAEDTFQAYYPREKQLNNVIISVSTTKPYETIEESFYELEQKLRALPRKEQRMITMGAL